VAALEKANGCTIEFSGLSNINCDSQASSSAG
jgi:hypothetical protein